MSILKQAENRKQLYILSNIVKKLLLQIPTNERISSHQLFLSMLTPAPYFAFPRTSKAFPLSQEQLSENLPRNITPPSISPTSTSDQNSWTPGQENTFQGSNQSEDNTEELTDVDIASINEHIAAICNILKI